MLVEIYSDLICPWCYIGQHQFRVALERHPRGAEITVGWRAFQLDPRAPRRAVPLIEAYTRKFGSEERARAAIVRMTAAAEAVGLEIRLDRARRANSFDAHRLVWFVGDGPTQWDLQLGLMRAYFVDGRDLADHATLIEAAEQVGLAPAEVEAFLSGTAGVRAVVEELREASERDVLAVPTFFIASTVGIPGAQEPETFERILDRAFARLAAASPSASPD